MLSRLKSMLVSFLVGLVIPFVLIAEGFAGSLEPPGAPTPTMKTLDQIPPTWDQLLPATERFQTVMGNAAILDKETGLVWEKNPEINAQLWADAGALCTAKTLGGRKGWRLPSLSELSSLVDPSRSNPALPMGHPFTNIHFTQGGYWTTTTSAADATKAWYVFFGNGGATIFTKLGQTYFWCVRGGQMQGDVQ